ncbi:hypothetical protein KBI52_10095 [Microvirga sp. HBU67558]|uniref:hypothetical protein n=1 Tax=Microvirga TaxID=186650 RepID=UPI001B3765A6|nr:MULTISPECIES: hypothetical protein [unclassified Microvirga]MBQ0820553.1 hypothetical protein [Microvirga sp. HBU67558]
MGEWATVYEDEVEGRLVAVKLYQSDQVADEDEGLAIRVMTSSAEEYPSVLKEEWSGDTLVIEEEARRPITLEPYSLDDLEGELMEVGFSPEAAALIASEIPV